jgi:protocatechuate 3,4-dioxygenase alpha subunit
VKDPEKADPLPVATPSQTVGPFFHFGLTLDRSHGTVRGVTGRQAIRLAVHVADGDGLPVSDAAVEIWHNGESGPTGSSAPGYTAPAGFGRLATDDDGWCEFTTVRPGPSTSAEGEVQSAHINICLFARGLLRQIHTRCYFADDPSLDKDPVLGLVPAERRDTLLAHADRAGRGRWVFDVRLQGTAETVFFSV